ncbi:hypothetical protein O3M35_002693 [Rhynocoris fuscipes]|uniref:BTB domain-containing protein n=1 Tax=Rhynocoris fuscipes TaxID=488301 RepID=A0AAW1CMN3_9HEMI
MAVQQFCLRWNNHQPNFISVFTSLLTNESLVDVTLAAEGKQLQAHKVVLSACSTYFQSLFAANPCQHPIVILKDIKYSDLKTMVDFMYYGEVNVSQDQLPAILKTAETLKVKGLAEMPEQLSLSKSVSQSSDGKCESQSPISPSVLRRKRLRKSSTGSGSEQTSEETAASGSGSTELVPPSPLKPETDESSLRREASSESETREGSHSFEEENYPPRNVSEEGESTTIRWSSSEERPSTSSQPPPQGWTSSREGCSSTLSSSDYKFPYPPSRRKRTSNPQQDENFLAALEAVRSGGLGFCKAAKLYGVNNRTLWLEYKKRGYPISRPSTKIRMGDNHQPSIVCTPTKPLKVNPIIEHTCTVQKLKTPGHGVSNSPHVQSCQVSGSFDYPPPPIYSYARQEGVYDAMDISKSNMFQVETFLH